MPVIITDSTCDLPPDVIQERGIHVVPIHIIRGTEDLLDGVDIDGETLYRTMAQSDVPLTTAQISVADFKQAFEPFRQDEVLCITVSSKLSGTYESAVLATQDYEKVTVFDSLTGSQALGFMVLQAAQMRDEGAAAQEIAAYLESVRPDVQIYFTLDTLKYLRRSGRINLLQHVLGKTLDLKPIIYEKDGMLAPCDRVRTRRRSLERLLDIVTEKIGSRAIKRMGVFDAQASEEADMLEARLLARFEPGEFYRSTIGAAIGTHGGPGAIGIAFDISD